MIHSYNNIYLHSIKKVRYVDIRVLYLPRPTHAYMIAALLGVRIAHTNITKQLFFLINWL